MLLARLRLPGAAGPGPTRGQIQPHQGDGEGAAGGGGRDSERMGSQHPHPLSGPVTPGHGGGGCSWDSGDPGDKPLAWHRLPGAPAGAFTSVGPHSSCSFLAWRLWGLVLSGPRQQLSRWNTCSKLNI